MTNINNRGIIKLNKTDLIFFCSLAVMLMPAYFASNAVIKLLGNICVLFIFYLLFVRLYKPSGFIYLLTLYYIYIVANTFINKNGDIHSIISSAKIVLMASFIDYMLRKHTYRAVNILYYIIFVYVLIDFLSVVLFPSGLYKTTIEWNQWSSSEFSQWVFGNKNNHIFWFLALLILAYIRYFLLKTKKRKNMLIFITFISIITPLILRSSTSLMVALIAASGIYLSDFKMRIKVRIEPYMVLLVYAAAAILIIFGSVSFLAPIIKGLFGKDLTFSNRTAAWAVVLLLISKKPVFGWGDMSNADAASMLGSKAFVNSHNQWLETLWQGGIVFFIITLFLILAAVSNLRKCIKIDFANTLIFIMAAYFIEMIFEVGLGNIVAWCPLLLCYHACNIEKLNENI